MRGVLIHLRVAHNASAHRIVGNVFHGNTERRVDRNTESGVACRNVAGSVLGYVECSYQLTSGRIDSAACRVVDCPVRHGNYRDSAIGERNFELVLRGAVLVDRNTTQDHRAARIHGGVFNQNLLAARHGTTFQSVACSQRGGLVFKQVHSRNELTSSSIDTTGFFIGRLPVSDLNVNLSAVAVGNTQREVGGRVLVNRVRADDDGACRVHGQVDAMHGLGGRLRNAVEQVSRTDRGGLIGSQFTYFQYTRSRVELASARVRRGKRGWSNTSRSTVIERRHHGVSSNRVLFEFGHTYDGNAHEVELDRYVFDQDVHESNLLRAALWVNPTRFDPNGFVLVNVNRLEDTSGCADGSVLAVTDDSPSYRHVNQRVAVAEHSISLERERHGFVERQACRTFDGQTVERRAVVHNVGSNRTTPHTKPFAVFCARSSDSQDLASSWTVCSRDFGSPGIHTRSTTDHSDRHLRMSVRQRRALVGHTQVVVTNNQRRRWIWHVFAVQLYQTTNRNRSGSHLWYIDFTQVEACAEIPELRLGDHIGVSGNFLPSVAILHGLIRGGTAQHFQVIGAVWIADDPADVERQGDVVGFQESNHDDQRLTVQQWDLHWDWVFQCKVPIVSERQCPFYKLGQSRRWHIQSPISFGYQRWSACATKQKLSWWPRELRLPLELRCR